MTAHPLPITREPGAAGGAAARSLQALHDRLLAAVQDLTNAQGWQQMLRTAAALPSYSPHNVLLIASQRPGVRAVAGFHTWRQLGRTVRKGEKGISILAPIVRRSGTPGEAAGHPSAELSALSGAADADPVAGRGVSGFRVVHVFDIGQTDGPELPAPPRPVRLAGAAPDGLIAGLTDQIREQGFQLLRRDPDMDSRLDLAHPGLSGANGVTDFLTWTVLVRADLSEAQAAKTLAHELGHVLLHAPASRRDATSREQAEVEAESVAYVVTAAHGLDSSSYTVAYVAGWAGTDLTLVARAAERVLGAASDVLRRTPPPPTLTLPAASRARLRDPRAATTVQQQVPPERAAAVPTQPATVDGERGRVAKAEQRTRGTRGAAGRRAVTPDAPGRPPDPQRSPHYRDRGVSR